MVEVILELIETMPELVIGAVVGLLALAPIARAQDAVLGQPREAGVFAKKRSTKVRDFYRQLGILSLLVIGIYAATQSGVV